MYFRIILPKLYFFLIFFFIVLQPNSDFVWYNKPSVSERRISNFILIFSPQLCYLFMFSHIQRGYFKFKPHFRIPMSKYCEEMFRLSRISITSLINFHRSRFLFLSIFFSSNNISVYFIIFIHQPSLPLPPLPFHIPNLLNHHSIFPQYLPNTVRWIWLTLYRDTHLKSCLITNILRIFV